MKTILLLLAVSLVAVQAENWAVLVSGSDGFWNYRHQSNVCHAYQILIRNGYKPDNIIVFSANDVAKSPYNPFPGKLYNKPSYKQPGVDVNQGCVIDYEGIYATPENFLAVLRGDVSQIEGGNGKVLKTTNQDRVFIFYADHGASGLICFPDDVYLYESDLIKTFKYMYENNRYSELVFYLEACESGSMFLNLPKNWRIYATSAASATESSWAYYCSPDDVVDGKHIGSCLGDHYSISWMEDTDLGDLTKTLHQQYQIVKKRTTGSQVIEWGDTSFSHHPIGYYHASDYKLTTANLLKAKFLQQMVAPDQARAVDSRDVKLQFLQVQSERTGGLKTQYELSQEIRSRLTADNQFNSLAYYFGFEPSALLLSFPPQDFDCLKNSIEVFSSSCGKLTDYSLKYVRFLVTVCEKRNDMPREDIYQGIKKVCTH